LPKHKDWTPNTVEEGKSVHQNGAVDPSKVMQEEVNDRSDSPEHKPIRLCQSPLVSVGVPISPQKFSTPVKVQRVHKSPNHLQVSSKQAYQVVSKLSAKKSVCPVTPDLSFTKDCSTDVVFPRTIKANLLQDVFKGPEEMTSPAPINWPMGSESEQIGLPAMPMTETSEKDNKFPSEQVWMSLTSPTTGSEDGGKRLESMNSMHSTSAMEERSSMSTNEERLTRSAIMKDELNKIVKPKRKLSVKQARRKQIELKLAEEKKKLNGEALVGIDVRKSKSKEGNSLSNPLMKKFSSSSRSGEAKIEEVKVSICNQLKPQIRSRQEDLKVRSGEAVAAERPKPTSIKPQISPQNSKIQYRENQNNLKEEADLSRSSLRSNTSRNTIPSVREQLFVPESLLTFPPDDDGSNDATISIDDLPPLRDSADRENEGTVIMSCDESQGTTTPGGYSTFLVENKESLPDSMLGDTGSFYQLPFQPHETDSNFSMPSVTQVQRAAVQDPTTEGMKQETEFDRKLWDHLAAINKKLKHNRWKVMDEYRQRLEEIDEHIKIWYAHENEKISDPRRKSKIADYLQDFEKQFNRMKEESNDFERSSNLKIPKILVNERNSIQSNSTPLGRTMFFPICDA